MKVFVRTRLIGEIDIPIPGRNIKRTIAITDRCYKDKVFPLHLIVSKEGKAEFCLSLWTKKDLIYFPELKEVR